MGDALEGYLVIKLQKELKKLKEKNKKMDTTYAENDFISINGDDGSWLDVSFDPDNNPELPVEIAVNSGNKKATQHIYLNYSELVQLSNTLRRFRQAA